MSGWLRNFQSGSVLFLVSAASPFRIIVAIQGHGSADFDEHVRIYLRDLVSIGVTQDTFRSDVDNRRATAPHIVHYLFRNRLCGRLMLLGYNRLKLAVRNQLFHLPEDLSVFAVSDEYPVRGLSRQLGSGG